ncbi:hypothetical protein [Janibacter cremeus]|uniref:Uncharacterized protein n=1 Tax=Janibacter cremeus TaxID=1285192 RepID=A0A852VQU3_9MICO|nr:hypothetical protein [Janibacter cremeus]NYF99397.1 hypothetical protein [Janibacter cremeus]
MTTTTERLAGTTTSLQHYALAVIAASLAMQLVLAACGHAVGILAGVLTALIALGYAGFLLRNRDRLGKVRFGLLAAHVVTFAAVVGGYLGHFFLLAVSGNAAVAAPSAGEDFVMDPGWFGVVVGMPTFWLMGLLAHSLGAILGRGFEAPR